MPNGIDYTPEEWETSAGHLPLKACPTEELMLLQRHWMWANVQREAMEQMFGTPEEPVEPGPMMMATKGVTFMFVWYGMLWSVIESCLKDRSLDFRGAFKADIDEVSDRLRLSRNAVLHVPKKNQLLDERIEDLVGNVSAITIRRIHRGFGRMFHDEMVRRTAENNAAQRG